MKLKKMGVESLLCLTGIAIIKSQPALGEDYLKSDIFDGFNYVGGSVSTDNQMLPPNLRGYAPTFRRGAHHSKSDRRARWGV
ncbi:fimbria/pilus outer membrane usher protein [Escherichia coli]